MYKVIIADDHIPVLNYLSASIAWDDLNMRLVASCADGEEALEACNLHKPDILITDIGMPVLNGLDVIETAVEANPKLKTIILSCHEDFQFAQRAVQLSVSGYILKESLQIEQLSSLLAKVKQKLDEENKVQNDQQQLQHVIKLNSDAIRTTFLHSLLEQPIWNEEEWTQQAKAIGISFVKGMPYLPVSVILEHPAMLEERFGGSHNMQFVFQNAMEELLSAEPVIRIAYNERIIFLLFPFPKTIVKNLHEELKLTLQHVQQQLEETLKLSLSFFIGEICNELNELKKQCQSLLESSEFRFYQPEHCIVKLQPFATTEEDFFIFYTDILQAVRNSIVNKDRQLAVETVHHWTTHILQTKYKKDTVLGLFLKLITEIELKYTVMKHFVTNFNAEQLHHTIYSIETLDYLEKWLIEYLEQKITAMESVADPSLRKEIAEAKRYIANHMSEKINMEDMAQRLNLNPSHFSRLFKSETGETFITYVTRIKMERAQELLDQSNLTIQEIAEHLGYEHTSYFIKLYRNFSGHSPNEQRRKL